MPENRGKREGNSLWAETTSFFKGEGRALTMKKKEEGVPGNEGRLRRGIEPFGPRGEQKRRIEEKKEIPAVTKRKYRCCPRRLCAGGGGRKKNDEEGKVLTAPGQN